jgi:hypothetical protein
MKIKKISIYLLASLFSTGLFINSCSDPDPELGVSEEIEAMSLSPEWNTYLVAASSELLDDCIALWAAWNGPNGLSSEEQARIGSDFFTRNADEIGAQGYAGLFSAAGPDNPLGSLKSQQAAIEMIINDGCMAIASEVGEAKIGEPNAKAEAGNREEAVLEVESWYSWNSITDFADNIASIKNSYWGGRGLEAPAAGSISAFVKSRDAALDTEVTGAIDAAYAAIKQGMEAPFREHLTGSDVDDAMDACADLEATLEKILPLLDGTDYNFTDALNAYSYQVVVPTYKAMKDAAWVLYNNAVAYQASPTQDNLGKVCEAWRANRIPWEQSEAFLFGPAEALGLDPSLDSWPLDQTAIWNILKSIQSGATVSQVISAIQDDAVRGFHTIELLLFKDGNDRIVAK